LDRDDQDGQGPETIAVHKQNALPGRYRCFVSNASATDIRGKDQYALARSGAEVTVIYGGQTERLRTSREAPGDIWRVCEINVTPAGATVQRLDTYEFSTAEPENLYSARTRGNREQWIGLYGGAPHTELAVSRGLEWLVRHQAQDGHWGADCLGTGPTTCCRGPRTCTTSGGPFSVAHSGLALLAFQAGGHYHFNANTHSDPVRRGLDWLVAHQEPNGALYSRAVGENHRDYMYEHGIAAWALCEACAVAAAAGQSPDRRYREAAEKAVRFIESQQHRDGGWRYSGRPEESSDTSVSGWQVLALKSGQEAGIEPSPACLAGAVRFFQSCRWLDSGKSRYYVFAPEPTPAVSGMGMLVQALVREQPDSEWVRKGAGYLADYAESQWGAPELGTETRCYLWHACTLAMFQHGGEPWKRWNDIVQERVRGSQDQDSQSCTFGSWDWQRDDFGKQGGRIYTTALAIPTLEVYYRYNSQRAKVYGAGS
jgi:hypothetical protein